MQLLASYLLVHKQPLLYKLSYIKALITTGVIGRYWPASGKGVGNLENPFTRPLFVPPFFKESPAWLKIFLGAKTSVACAWTICGRSCGTPSFYTWGHFGASLWGTLEDWPPSFSLFVGYTGGDDKCVTHT